MIKINPKQTVESLKAYGFTNYDKPTLYMCKGLELTITFNMSISIKTFKVEIDVLDNDFCQPYDYQYFLSKNPNHEFARKIEKKVNAILAKLQADGIIEGYLEGMYI